jgi:hypothetical protein
MNLDLNDEKWVNMTRFLMGIYPNGADLYTIANQYKENYEQQKGTAINNDILFDLIKSKLDYERDVHRSIEIHMGKNNDNQKVPFIKITDIGVKQIWQYMNHLHKRESSEYIDWLIRWKDEDEIASHKFNELIKTEFSGYVGILSTLTTPIQFQNIIRGVVTLESFEITGEESYNKVATTVHNFIKKMIGYGVMYKSNVIQPVMNDNNEPVEANVEMFQLTNTGIFILNYIYSKIDIERPSSMSVESNLPNSANYHVNFIIKVIISLAVCFAILLFADNYTAKLGLETSSSIIFIGPVVLYGVSYLYDTIRDRVLRKYIRMNKFKK